MNLFIKFIHLYRLHDGGFFLDQTNDGGPQPPTWINWMENIQMCKLTVDMKYSGKKTKLILINTYVFITIRI